MNTNAERPDFNRTHPECPEGMEFLRNIIPAYPEGWKFPEGYVIGTNAYHPEGRLLREMGDGGLAAFRPVFIPAAKKRKTA